MTFIELKNELENLTLDSNLIHSTTNDGRLESAESEQIICSLLQDYFKNNDNIIINPAPKARFWYDIGITVDNVFYPINIKITNGNTADNVSSKKGMFYALTGIDPETIAGLDKWEKYNNLLIKNLNFEQDKDYYFLIYFKDSKTFFFTSLKRIDTLVPNGNNLPFQCCWKKNLNYTNRTKIEQGYYIMNVFINSFKKKISGLDILLNWEKQNE